MSALGINGKLQEVGQGKPGRRSSRVTSESTGEMPWMPITGYSHGTVEEHCEKYNLAASHPP